MEETAEEIITDFIDAIPKINVSTTIAGAPANKNRAMLSIDKLDEAAIPAKHGTKINNKGMIPNLAASALSQIVFEVECEAA